MNVEELESIIRDELRRDAANAPSGRQLRTAVLDAVVAELPMVDRPVRRWVVPLLVAAAVVALAVAATLLPRTFGKHSQPAHPKPSPAPSLPAAPAPVGVSCAAGQQLVSGLGTRTTDSTGKVGYAYEYYCAGSDGNRTGSQIEWFLMVNGRLVFQPQELTVAGASLYVMSLTGTVGGLVLRAYDATPGIAGHPGGVVEEWTIQLDADSALSASRLIAQPCLANDLTVRTTDASEPTPHSVLRLTNHSGKACAVWGNPRYRQVGGATPVKFGSVLRGPAGGLANEPSAPPLLLQPGQTASAAIGTDPSVTGGCNVTDFTAALPNGVQLGSAHFSACSVVSYPLVLAENGSEAHPDSEAPASATGNCPNTGVILDFGHAQLRAGQRVGTTLVITSAGSVSCTITGYPNVRALDAGGNLQRIAAQTPRSPLGGLAGTLIPQVIVTPGHPASAVVDWSANSTACAPGRLSWTLGGNTLGFDGPPAGPYCDLQVHPFVPGSTGSEAHPESGAPASATGSCLDAGDMAVGSEPVELRAGHQVGTIVTLSTTGSGSCTITGYPNIRAVDENGNLLQFPSQTLHGTLGGLAGGQLPQITVAPGRPASAVVEWSDTGTSGQCFSGGHLSFTLGGTTSIGDRLSSPFCDLQVHPFVPGSTGNG